MESRKRVVPDSVPQFVIDHAPLLHLSSIDPYHPTPLSAPLAHTTPRIAHSPVPSPPSPLTLSNLSQLNALSTKNGKDVFLTSNEDVASGPEWMKGGDGGLEGEVKGVGIVVDKGGGVVDVFWFGFWGFNWGGVVLGKQLGDHVGDWEHTMIRFENGVPKYVWFSQHANGEAYAFSALKKDKSGKRPLVYVANGSHALYPTPGAHDHTIPNLNLPYKLLLVDTTDEGPLYDPVLSSYFYTFTPSTETFTPYDGSSPTGFLEFRGHWGDDELPGSDKRQDDLLGNKKYVGGPTGPIDKKLDRKEVWPDNGFSSGQRIRYSLEPGIGGVIRDWVRKLKCGGKKEKVRKVLVSGEEIE